MNCFFYGTLLEPRVLHAVLRHPVVPSRLQAAVLPGYRRVFREGASYPVVVPDRRSSVDGAVVCGLTARDAWFLRLYEGPEYETARPAVRVARSGKAVLAQVFVPGQACVPATEPWRYATWRRRFGRDYLRHVLRTRRAPVAAGRLPPATGPA